MLDVSDAHVRLRRAGRLLHTTGAQLQEWLASEPLRWHFQRDPDVAVDQYVVEVVRPVPEDVAAGAGDFANNVRSALNYAAMAIYASAGGNLGSHDARAVDFPIAESEKQWRSALSRCLSQAWPEATAVLRRYQPCSGPSPSAAALVNLQEVNNADKHRYLHVVGSATTTVEATMADVLPQGAVYDMFMAHPAGRLDVANTFLVSRYLIHRGNEDAAAPISDQAVAGAVPRWKGMSQEVPPPPTLTLHLYGQRAVSFDELSPMLATATDMISAVEQLTPPSAFTK